MESKKKWIFNIIFLLLIFAATFYGVFHGKDMGRIIEIIKNCEPVLVDSRRYLCNNLHMGRIYHYSLSDAFTWYKGKEMDLLFYFHPLAFSLAALLRLHRVVSRHRFTI